MERQAEPPPRERPADAAAPAPALRITVKGREGEGLSARLELAAAAVTGSALLLVHLVRDGGLSGDAAPLVLGAAAAGHLLLLRPLAYAVRRLRRDDARLRAALACPYCKDRLPSDSAVACERAGCGAHYHTDCWAECRQTYGGCAIFGCGSRDGREVGAFALTRRLVWQALATALFPPALAKRAVAYRVEQAQPAVAGTRLGHGSWAFAALFAVVGSIGAIVLAGELGRRGVVGPGWVWVAICLAAVVLPVATVRGPLALLSFVLELFSDELAALQRADEGTFLARLAGGAGKKEG